MARVIFTANIQRHIACPTQVAAGNSVREVLESVFTRNPPARGYILDDQGAVRKNIAVFVDGQLLVDRQHLTDAIGDHTEIYIMQALSGG